MKKIAVIGCGQLGSRHLQALMKSEYAASIEVMDPSPDSLNTARERAGQIPQNPNIQEVKYYSSLEALSEQIDLAVIATNSNIRAEIVKELLQRKKVSNMIIEKVLFQKIREYGEIARLLKAKKVSAWVNCPRRLYPFYQNLRDILSKEGPLSYCLQGGEWGLACNAIHFIDHVAFFNGCHDVRFDTSGLDPKILESRRKGFIELTGTIHGAFADGSRIILHAHSGSAAPHIIGIVGKNVQVMVDESKQKAHIARAEKNWTWEEEPFRVLYQSEMTHLAARDILEKGKCGLTTYENSQKLHVSFIAALLKFISKVKGEKTSVCPVT